MASSRSSLRSRRRGSGSGNNPLVQQYVILADNIEEITPPPSTDSSLFSSSSELSSGGGSAAARNNNNNAIGRSLPAAANQRVAVASSNNNNHGGRRVAVGRNDNNNRQQAAPPPPQVVDVLAARQQQQVESPDDDDLLSPAGDASALVPPEAPSPPIEQQQEDSPSLAAPADYPPCSANAQIVAASSASSSNDDHDDYKDDVAKIDSKPLVIEDVPDEEVFQKSSEYYEESLPEEQQYHAQLLEQYPDLFAKPGEPCSMDEYDPEEYYVEDVAHIEDNDPKNPKRLKPPGKIPLPPVPTGQCEWEVVSQYVMRATFIHRHDGIKREIHPADKEYLFKLYQTHMRVILRNPLPLWKSDLWTLGRILDTVKDEYHHRFRRFDWDKKTQKYEEADGMLTMKVSRYFNYLEARDKALKQKESIDKDGKFAEFEIEDPHGKKEIIDPAETVIYMIDYDLVKNLPLHHKDMEENLVVPGIYPGKEMCAMHPLHAEGQPFMGPNLYATPPEAFTHFHQDGHGTVDSGHLVLSGTNEVIIMRRLPEAHKLNAYKIIGFPDPKNMLYNEPHSDRLKKPGWPTKKIVDDLNELGYCAAALTLEAGDLLLIPKGSLHAFRKMTNQLLPDTDAHADLRKNLLSNPDFIYQPLCVSKAWDWDFLGVTAAGINRERVTAMENAALAEKRGLQVLAPTQTTVLRNIRGHIHRLETQERRSLVGFPHPHSKPSAEIPPESLEILSGLRPALQHIVEMQKKLENDSKTDSSKAVTLSSIPDASADPTTSKIDPHGISSYQCKLCNAELSNGYLHCVGCEDYLEQDYNICIDCFKNGYYKAFDQMDVTNKAKNATVNHCGHFTDTSNVSRKCPCKNKGTKCAVCKFCTGCSCKCHQSFELRYRHFSTQNLQQLLSDVNRSVAGHRIKYDDRACERLRLARKNVEDSVEEKKKFCFDKRIQVPKGEEPSKKNSKAQSSTNKRKREATDATTDEASAPKRSHSVTPATVAPRSTPLSAAAPSTSKPSASPGSRRSDRKGKPKKYDHEDERKPQATVRPKQPAAAPQGVLATGTTRLPRSQIAPHPGSPPEAGPAAGSIASTSPEEMDAVQTLTGLFASGTLPADENSGPQV